MKTRTKLLASCVMLCSLLGLQVKAQWYGQQQYQHDSTILSSAIIPANAPGYVMAGFRPVRQSGSNSPDFVIDKVNISGGFSSAADFAAEYQIVLSCPANTVVNQCSGVSIIEATNAGAGEAYAIAGACRMGMFFATINNTGNIISQNFWPFPFPSITVWKPEITPSASGREYYICGSYNGSAYVVKVAVNGVPVWGNWYLANAMEARDLIESPYNPNELIVVGRTDITNTITAADAMFMKLDAGNGSVLSFKHYQFLTWDSDDWFSCIEVANSPTGGSGYILGGRAVGPTRTPLPSDILTNARYSQWMCKLDPAGNIIWTTLIKPAATPFMPPNHSGPEINGVFERFNPNSSSYEYYGEAGSYYTPASLSSGVTRSNLVVYKLNDVGQVGSLTPTEFHYIGANEAPTAGNNHYYSDLTGIETGGGADDGIQVFGTTTLSHNEHHFIKAYFNGTSGCDEEITDIDSLFTGPTYYGSGNPSVSAFNDCGALSLNPAQGFKNVTNSCFASSVAGGSNARLAGITKLKAENNGIRIYPNHVNHELTVSLTGKAIVIIYNALGQKLSEYSFDNEKGGELKIDFEALHVKAGIYSVQVNTASASSNYKVMYEQK